MREVRKKEAAEILKTALLPNFGRRNGSLRSAIFMKLQSSLGITLVFLGILLPVCAPAQSDSEVSLGDLARSLRKSKEPAAPAVNVIDNDNFSQVIEQVASLRLSRSPLFSFDGAGKNFQMSSPDGTCSLSFNANATALLSNPFVATDLPPGELGKLDGPASLDGDSLQVSVYNAGAWNVKEITVSLTIVRRVDTNAAYFGSAQLLPAVAGDAQPAEKPAEKHPDLTLLLHLKGAAMPSATATFREKLPSALGPDQEWHWAIVAAKGIPPDPISGTPAN